MMILYVLWRGVLVLLTFVGWVLGIIVGTFIGGLVAGFKRGFEG